MYPRARVFALALGMLAIFSPIGLKAESTPAAEEEKAEDANAALLKRVKLALDSYYDAKLTAESQKKAFDVQKAWDAAAAKAGFNDRKDLEDQVAKARQAGGAEFQKAYNALLAEAKARYEKRAKGE